MLDVRVSSRAAAPRRLGPFCLSHPFSAWDLIFFTNFICSGSHHHPFLAFISCRRNELSFVTITPDDTHMFCEHPHAKGSNNGNHLAEWKKKIVGSVTLEALLLENDVKRKDQNAALLQ